MRNQRFQLALIAGPAIIHDHQPPIWSIINIRSVTLELPLGVVSHDHPVSKQLTGFAKAAADNFLAVLKFWQTWIGQLPIGQMFIVSRPPRRIGEELFASLVELAQCTLHYCSTGQRQECTEAIVVNCEICQKN